MLAIIIIRLIYGRQALRKLTTANSQTHIVLSAATAMQVAAIIFVTTTARVRTACSMGSTVNIIPITKLAIFSISWIVSFFFSQFDFLPSAFSAVDLRTASEVKAIVLFSISPSLFSQMSKASLSVKSLIVFSALSSASSISSLCLFSARFKTADTKPPELAIEAWHLPIASTTG